MVSGQPGRECQLAAGRAGELRVTGFALDQLGGVQPHLLELAHRTWHVGMGTKSDRGPGAPLTQREKMGVQSLQDQGTGGA